MECQSHFSSQSFVRFYGILMKWTIFILNLIMKLINLDVDVNILVLEIILFIR